MQLLKLKFKIFTSSVSKFQVLVSHTWLVAVVLESSDKENFSIIIIFAKSTIIQHWSRTFIISTSSLWKHTFWLFPVGHCIPHGSTRETETLRSKSSYGNMILVCDIGFINLISVSKPVDVCFAVLQSSKPEILNSSKNSSNFLVITISIYLLLFYDNLLSPLLLRPRCFLASRPES